MSVPELHSMDFLRRICRADRRDVEIESILKEHDIPYTVQSPKGGGRPRNFLIGSGPNVVGAHWDIDPGTKHGANDNSAAVAQLLDFAVQVTGRKLDVTIALWDLEEPGNSRFGSPGSQLFARSRPESYGLVLVLDVTGIGDTVALSTSCGLDFIMGHRVAVVADAFDVPWCVCSTPPSDNMYFDRAVLMSTVRGSDPWPPPHWSNLHRPSDSLDSIEEGAMRLVQRLLLGLAEVNFNQSSGYYLGPADSFNWSLRRNGR